MSARRSISTIVEKDFCSLPLINFVGTHGTSLTVGQDAKRISYHETLATTRPPP